MSSRADGARFQRFIFERRGSSSPSVAHGELLARRRCLRVESLEDRSLLSAVPLQAESAAVYEPSPSTYAHFVTVRLELQSVPVVEIQPGDANSDGTVDFVDYQVLADNFLSGGNWAQGDFNLDFFIDGADYVIWADHYALPAPAEAEAPATVPAAAIPAPATSEDPTLDTALLESLTEPAAAAPLVTLCQTRAPSHDEDQSPQTAAAMNEAATTTDWLDTSSLFESAQSLQMAAVAQAWDLAANDGSLGKSRSGAK